MRGSHRLRGVWNTLRAAAAMRWPCDEHDVFGYRLDFSGHADVCMRCPFAHKSVAPPSIAMFEPMPSTRHRTWACRRQGTTPDASSRRLIAVASLAIPLGLGLTAFGAHSHAQPSSVISDDSVRVIAILAPPDDGRYQMGGGLSARCRRAEAQTAGRRLRTDAHEVLHSHDAELMPTLEVRRDVIRLIREWDADVVIGHRPNDDHLDHRNAGKVVRDAAYIAAYIAAYMVQVSNVLPHVPPTDGNPVFLYMQDRFETPYPFQAHVAVDVGRVRETKIDALDAHKSQMYEGLPWVSGSLDQVPAEDDAYRQ